MEDKELIEEYLSGNTEAFEQLLRPHLRPLYGFVFTLVHDREAAEDIVQTTSIKAWKHLVKFDTQKSFKTWLFAIGKNTAYDFLKKKKTIPFSAFSDEDEENPLEMIKDDELLPDDIFEQEETVERISRALTCIPEKYGTILTLFYREDFSLVEIAQILGIPYNTVKSHHYRGIQALRKVLVSEEEHIAPKQEKQS